MRVSFEFIAVFLYGIIVVTFSCVLHVRILRYNRVYCVLCPEKLTTTKSPKTLFSTALINWTEHYRSAKTMHQGDIEGSADRIVKLKKKAETSSKKRVDQFPDLAVPSGLSCKMVIVKLSLKLNRAGNFWVLTDIL